MYKEFGAGLALLMAAICGGHAQEAGPVKIGVLTDMSGPLSDTTGRGSAIAVQMAIEEFGGKVLGRPVVSISADHQNKADIGAAIARRWYDTEGVDMITDLQNSSVALAVQDLARGRGKLTIVTGAGTSELTGAACSATGIHWTVDTYSAATSLAKAVSNRASQTWYILAADYAFGHALQKDVTQALSGGAGKIVGAVRVPLGTQDYSSFLLQAQASGAQILALANAGNDTVVSAKQAKEFGLPEQGMTLVGLYAGIHPVKAMGLPIAQNMLIPETFYWDMDDRTRRFSNRFYERMGSMPSQLHAGAYSATLNYLKAVDKAGTAHPAKVVEALRSMPIEDDVTRNGRLRGDGRMVHDTYLFRVKTPAQSSREWDVYEVLATISGDDAFRPQRDGGCPLVQ